MTVGIWQVQEQKSMTGLRSRWRENAPSNCWWHQAQPLRVPALQSLPFLPQPLTPPPKLSTMPMLSSDVPTSSALSVLVSTVALQKRSWDDSLQGRSLGLKVSEGSVHGCGLHYFWISCEKNIVVRGYGDIFFFTPVSRKQGETETRCIHPS